MTQAITDYNKIPQRFHKYDSSDIDDPLKDIAILTKPEENLALMMKDGKICKNTVK